MNRDFKGIWIPREIWLFKGVSLLAKSLWAEIHSLYSEEMGGCYASNEYLAEFAGLKERRVRDAIYELKDCGLVEEVSFNGRVRVLKAVLKPSKSVKSSGKSANSGRQNGTVLPGRLAVSCQADRQYPARLAQGDIQYSEKSIEKRREEDTHPTLSHDEIETGEKTEAAPPPQAGPPPCERVFVEEKPVKPKTDRKAPSQPPKAKELCTHRWGCVCLTRADYDALAEKHGASGVEELAQELADAIDAGSYKPKRKNPSYKATLNIWFRKEWHRSKSKFYRQEDLGKKPTSTLKNKRPSHDHSDAAYEGMRNKPINIRDLE